MTCVCDVCTCVYKHVHMYVHIQCANVAHDKVLFSTIVGLTEVQVKSVEEAKLLAAYGQYNRKIGSTALNQKSSRRWVSLGARGGGVDVHGVRGEGVSLGGRHIRTYVH